MLFGRSGACSVSVQTTCGMSLQSARALVVGGRMRGEMAVPERFLGFWEGCLNPMLGTLNSKSRVLDIRTWSSGP